MSTPAARPARSDAQMDQKRRVDRLKHKANRDENKRRMENIERELSLLRSSVDELTQLMQEQLRHLREPPTMSSTGTAAGLFYPSIPQQQQHHQHHQQQQQQQQTNAQSTATDHSSSNNNILPTPFDTRHLPILDLNEKPTTAGSLPPQLLGAVDCRCGVEHQHPSQCLEYASFAILYQAHVAISLTQHSAAPELLPRNPTVANMTLNSTDDNPVIFFIGSVLRHFETADVETLFGLFFVSYRLLRWRLHPDAESLEDVPVWLRLTKVQRAYVHPICIDYIPWPAMRDYLCLHQYRDTRHSVALYMKSLRLLWPASEPLLLKKTRSEVTLNPNFEAFAGDLRNWRLGSPWADTFPDLVQHVTV